MVSEDDYICPENQWQVQILSRDNELKDHELRLLYQHVRDTCVPMSSLELTVPGENNALLYFLSKHFKLDLIVSVFGYAKVDYI